MVILIVFGSIILVVILFAISVIVDKIVSSRDAKA